MPRTPTMSVEVERKDGGTQLKLWLSKAFWQRIECQIRPGSPQAFAVTCANLLTADGPQAYHASKWATSLYVGDIGEYSLCYPGNRLFVEGRPNLTAFLIQEVTADGGATFTLVDFVTQKQAEMLCEKMKEWVSGLATELFQEFSVKTEVSLHIIARE